MRLLAFETSTEACSVAVYVDGRVLERFEIAPRRHTELALLWAEALLAEAGVARSQLDAIAVGRGPGAFTGVRLAIALAQGVALGLDLPVLPVSTLAVLAMQAGGERRISAIDARMGEVYLGTFARQGEGLLALSEETVVRPDVAVIPAGDGWHGAGTGFGAADGALQLRLQGRLATVDAQALPRAADVARLAAPVFAAGGGIAPERAEPAYLRNDVALTLAQQRAARDAEPPRQS